MRAGAKARLLGALARESWARSVSSTASLGHDLPQSKSFWRPPLNFQHHIGYFLPH